MRKRKLILTFFLIALTGCGTNVNHIENAGFDNWAELPDLWHLEGKAEVRSAGRSVVELVPEGEGAPFLYQPLKMRRIYKGNTVTLSAMVKSSVPGNAALQVSDRLGRDVTSPFHPGDGRWHILKVTAVVPETAKVLEVRFRNFKSASALYKSPFLVLGTGSPLIRKDKGKVFRVENGTYAALGLVALALLLVATHVYTKGWMPAGRARAAKAFLTLVLISNMMLITGRPDYAMYASAAAWAGFTAGSAYFIVQRYGLKIIATPLIWAVKRPVYAFVFASVISTFLVILYLYLGGTHLATEAARSAYIFMVLGAGAAMVSRLVSKMRVYDEKERLGEPEGLSSGEQAVARRSLTLLKRR